MQDRYEHTHGGKSATTEQQVISESDSIDGLCAVKVKEEDTPSGWMQPYVSLKIGNFEFKRLYHTKDGADRCAEKTKALLNICA